MSLTQQNTKGEAAFDCVYPSSPVAELCHRALPLNNLGFTLLILRAKKDKSSHVIKAGLDWCGNIFAIPQQCFEGVGAELLLIHKLLSRGQGDIQLALVGIDLCRQFVRDPFGGALSFNLKGGLSTVQLYFFKLGS